MRCISRLSIAACFAGASISCILSTSAFSFVPTAVRTSCSRSRDLPTLKSIIHPNTEYDGDSRNDKHLNSLTRSESFEEPRSPSLRLRLKGMGSRVWNRLDTMKAAGLWQDDMVPMQAGFKTNVMILVGAFLFKWYRARFVTKIPVWDRQPQWNMVVTSPEQEKELHAYQCKSCGSTIFIARHREWFFQGGNTQCTNCGAKGSENFVDIRSAVIDEVDDDYFEYTNPLDFVSVAEKRRLVKEAGGDEELAKKIAIEKAIKEDPKQVQIQPPVALTGDAEKKSSSKKTSQPKQESDDDLLDELGMDV